MISVSKDKRGKIQMSIFSGPVGSSPTKPSMELQGKLSAMKVYNIDLGIEELMRKRDSMKRMVQFEEEERANIQRDVTALTKRLSDTEESLSRKYACLEDYENTIHNVESAYSKIFESSQALLQVLQTENCNHISQCAR